MGRIFTLACLLLAALAASAVPYVHEAMRAQAGGTIGTMAGMPGMAAPLVSEVPYQIAQAAIAAKVALAALSVAGLVLGRLRRDRSSAAGSIVATSVALGAALAIGLAAFDCCTQFHGGGSDASGGCHCWVTGLLAAAGALAAALATLFGRAIRAWAAALVRVIVALVVRLAPCSLAAASRVRHARRTVRRPTPLVARRTPGRAPPLYA